MKRISRSLKSEFSRGFYYCYTTCFLTYVIIKINKLILILILILKIQIRIFFSTYFIISRVRPFSKITLKIKYTKFYI